MRHVDLMGIHVEALSGAPVLLLREETEPHRVLPIFVGAAEATAIALAATGQVPPRPLTHDLLATVLETLDAHVDAVEVTGIRDGAFLAELALSGPDGKHRIDSRPSDAIALAVRVGAPVLVSESVLDAVGTMITTAEHDGGADEQAIDAAVDEFRRLLDNIDPTQLAAAIADDVPPTPRTDLTSDEEDDTGSGERS
jgi:bifunctional DNase/RNase